MRTRGNAAGAAAASAPLLLLLLAAAARTASSQATVDQFADTYWCGRTWPHADAECPLACPTGEDEVCSSALGDDHSCFFFTACADRVQPDDGGDDSTEEEVSDGSENNFCGRSWLHAMLTCDAERSCPGGWECGVPGETCFAATGCDRPLIQLVSELLTTLQGPDTVMEDDEDIDLFGGTIYDFIAEFAGDRDIALDAVDVGDQKVVDQRRLSARYDDRLAGRGHPTLGSSWMGVRISNVTQRMLPSGSSAIDVSMVVTGDYRPPPYLDLDVIAEDSINRNGDKVVSTLRDRGERAGREYFQRVQGIETVARKEVTMRPTRSPTGRPTPAPTGDPTPVPSGMPSEFPSLEPSGVPSRTLDNVIMTGSREDLQLGGLTTSSYGYVFNIRTKPDANVVLLTGMDFYTESTSDVNFELWTYAGNYQDKKGAVDGSWTKIGGGVTRGRGIGRYTTIPEGMFKPTSIDGGGASRAFYLTLDTINLVYKLGKDAGIRGAPPDTYVHHESPDIEVWEGEGVLQYNRTNAKEGLPPFPDTSVTVFYRYPRSYLGAIYYDRVPCKPYSVYGDLQSLPCPLVPTGTPTVPPPTKSPATAEPSVQPTTEAPTTAAPIPGVTPAPITPTESPTVAPTSSFPPTMFPTTTRPTNSPVIPMRTNFVATLRNVPKRDMTSREVEKYIEILTAFLRRHTEQSMVIEGIEFWHQHLLVLPAMVEELEEEDAEAPALAAAEEESEEPDAGEEEGKDDSTVAEDESALDVEETELSPEEELTIDAELAAVEKEASKLADDGGDGQPDEEEADEDEGDEEDASPQIAGKRSLHPSKKRHVHPAPEVLDCDHPELAHAAGYTCGMEVHLILKVSYAFLPYELLSDMAVVAIEENESELLDLLHEQQAFYTFFRNMDQVTSRVIEGDMTLAPTVAPSTLAYMEANQAQEILNLTATEDSGIGFGVMVGVGVGFLWCCLTAVAVACLMKARGEIMEQRDMENLLKAQRDGPIASSSSSPPEVRKDAELGSKHDHSTDSDDESDPFDHTKNSRLAPRARAEVAKSVREGGAGSGAVVAHRVSHARSMVVQRNQDDIEEGKSGALRHSAKASLASGPEVGKGPGAVGAHRVSHARSMVVQRNQDNMGEGKSGELRQSAKASLASGPEVGKGPGAVGAHRVSHARSMVVQRNQDNIGEGKSGELRQSAKARLASGPEARRGGGRAAAEHSQSMSAVPRSDPNRASVGRRGKALDGSSRSASMPVEGHKGGSSDARRSARKSSSMGDDSVRSGSSRRRSSNGSSRRKGARDEATRQSTRRKGT